MAYPREQWKNNMPELSVYLDFINLVKSIMVLNDILLPKITILDKSVASSVRIISDVSVSRISYTKFT